MTDAAEKKDKLRLVSHFPGRLRVRAVTFRTKPEVARDVTEKLAEHPGISGAVVSPVTGSMVVTYEPREIQLPRIVILLCELAGLHGLEVDAEVDWTKKPRQGTEVREAFGKANDLLRSFSKGKVDLQTAVPGALASMGFGLLLGGRFRMPEWYDFLFWSFVTFQNLNPRDVERVRSEGEADDGRPKQ